MSSSSEESVSTDPFDKLLCNPLWSNLVLCSKSGLTLTKEQLDLGTNILGGQTGELHTTSPESSGPSDVSLRQGEETYSAESIYLPDNDPNADTLPPDSSVSESSTGSEGMGIEAGVDHYSESCLPYNAVASVNNMKFFL